MIFWYLHSLHFFSLVMCFFNAELALLRHQYYLVPSSSYRTIIYLSIVYAIGQVAMAVSAIHDITDVDRDGTPDNMTFHVWVSTYYRHIELFASGWQYLLLIHMSLFSCSAMSMVGLFLIALGTGGIKPCVAAFGGDQFSEHQVWALPHFCLCIGFTFL